jgi:hypothetical protein
MYFNAEMLERIKASILEVEKGDVKQISSAKEISDLLGL